MKTWAVIVAIGMMALLSESIRDQESSQQHAAWILFGIGVVIALLVMLAMRFAPVLKEVSARVSRSSPQQSAVVAASLGLMALISVAGRLQPVFFGVLSGAMVSVAFLFPQQREEVKRGDEPPGLTEDGDGDNEERGMHE